MTAACAPERPRSLAAPGGAAIEAGQPRRAAPAPVAAVDPGEPAAPRLVERYPAVGGAPPRGPVRIGSAAPVTPAGDGQGVQLNFRDADIRDVVQVVLGDMLKANYSIDPKVGGPLTLQTNQPVPLAHLAQTLRAILETRGFTMTEVDGIYRVMAEPPGKAPAAFPGAQTRVFPLRHAVPEELRKVLSLIVPAERMTVVEGRNLLAVSGTGLELQAAADTVAAFDVDAMRGTSVLLVGLDHAEPDAMVAELDGIFGRAAQGPTGGLVRFMAVPRLGAVIVMSGQQSYLDQAFEWIKRLDRVRHVGGRRLFVYNVQHRKASDLAKSLNGLFGEPSQADEGAAQPAASAVPPAAGILAAPTDVYAVNPRLESGAPASAPAPRPAAPAAKLAARDNLRIVVDETNNALLIAATATQYGLIQDVLRQIDVVPLQVLVEATILEVVLGDSLRYGVAYSVNTNGFLGYDRSTVLFNPLRAAASIVPTVPGFAFSVGTANRPEVIIEALASMTNVKVVSSPKLLVLDNQTARLLVGDSVPIVTQQTTGTQVSNPLIVNSIQYRDTGVSLEVTPRVNNSGFVNLDILQEISDVARTTTSNIDSPTIQQRKVLTSVAIKSGQTVMLGGLIRESQNETNSGLPGLKDLPILGSLFGSTSAVAGRTELLALLTPHVVRNEDEARDITQEMRRKFEGALQVEGLKLRAPRR